MAGTDTLVDKSEPCPNCGHCPTCGNTPQKMAPYPWYPIYPWYTQPSVMNPDITWGGDTGNITITSTNFEVTQ